MRRGTSFLYSSRKASLCPLRVTQGACRSPCVLPSGNMWQPMGSRTPYSWKKRPRHGDRGCVFGTQVSHGCAHDGHRHVLYRPHTAGAMAVIGHAIVSATVIAMARVVKNLYKRLYIYAKPGAKMYKYTVATASFRGINPEKIQQTRTVFGAVGAVLGHREDCKSNNLLQNRAIYRPFRRYFRLLRGWFSGSPRWSFFCSRWSLES